MFKERRNQTFLHHIKYISIRQIIQLFHYFFNVPAKSLITHQYRSQISFIQEKETTFYTFYSPTILIITNRKPYTYNIINTSLTAYIDEIIRINRNVGIFPRATTGQRSVNGQGRGGKGPSARWKASGKLLAGRFCQDTEEHRLFRDPIRLHPFREPSSQPLSPSSPPAHSGITVLRAYPRGTRVYAPAKKSGKPLSLLAD